MGKGIFCFEIWIFKKKTENSYESDLTKPIIEGQEVRLYFELFFTDLTLYINGRKVPVPGHHTPRFHVDITDYLDYGKVNRIFIRAENSDSKYIKRGGIRSNLWLEVRPAQNFGEAAVDTSIRKKSIQIRFLNSKLSGGTLHGKIRDAKDNNTVHTFSVPFSGSVTIPYITPKLWSMEDPALYFMDLTLKDGTGKILDSRSVRFGFREFRIAGGNYLLNEKPVTLITDTSWPSWWTPVWNLEPDFVRKAFRTLKKMNVNSIYGRYAVMPDSFMDVADEEGIMVIYAFNNPVSVIQRTPAAQYRTELESVLREQQDARTLINHPANVGILLDVWYNFHRGVTHPAFIGMRSDASERMEPDADGRFHRVKGSDPNLKTMLYERRQNELRDLAALCRKYYPLMEVFTGTDGHVENSYGAHIYHTWKAPLAELSALFSRYSLTRDIPVFSGEMNIPFAGSFSDIRSYPNKSPLYKENAARLMGNKAYNMPGIYSGYAYSNYKNDFLANTSGRDSADNATYYFLGELYGIPFQEYAEHTLFPWRYDGLNGIGVFEYVLTSRLILAARSYPELDFLKGDFSRPGCKAEILAGTHHRPVFDLQGDDLLLRPNIITIPYLRGTAPLSAAFAGGASERYEVDHAYFEGETLEKQLAVINRTGETQKFQVSVRLLDRTGAVAAEKQFTAEIAPYTNKSFPFSMQIPQVFVRNEYSLAARLDAQNRKLTCSMNIEVFPKINTAQNHNRTLSLFDCTDDFAERVKQLGFKVEKITDPQNVPAGSVAVIGAHAMENNRGRSAFDSMLKNNVRILVMEQTETASPELMKVRCRKTFRNAAGHPVLQGFKDSDFANWRGSAASIPGYGPVQGGEQWQDWGARNMVAAHVFRRPAYGNFIPLLVSGFDLFQTPLLEYRSPDKLWIASQLEISGRLGTDPVATIVFNRMVNYLGMRLPHRVQTAFIGGGKGKSMLEKMMVKYTPVKLSSDWREYTNLIISDPDWNELRKYAFELADFVYSGGNIFYLHTGKDFSSAWLPFILELNQFEARQAVVSGEADHIWRHGWDSNDLYWHNPVAVPAFSNVPAAAESTSPAVLVRRKYGSGSFIFCSITPEVFGKSPAAGKTLRIISNLLTSISAEVGRQIHVYSENRSFHLNLTNIHWSFAKDPLDIGLREKWFAGQGKPPWITGQMTVSGEYVRAGIPWKNFLEDDYRGTGWYKLEFNLSEEESRMSSLMVSCHQLWSEDTAWLNGHKIGQYDKPGALRNYRFPERFLKPGKNTLVFRIRDTGGKGGLCGPAAIRSRTGGKKAWVTPYPDGSERDYSYPADMLRMY